MARKADRPSFESWGRYPARNSALVPLYWPSDFPLGPSVDVEGGHSPHGSHRMLPVGMGRSYGDVCLVANGTLLSTRGLDRFQAFDDDEGVLRCEAGVTLGEILNLCIPRGWFLPVTAGTRSVTVGGAIANDIHGKNHNTAGTFGRHVRSFELVRSDGSRFTCSPAQNAEWFRGTIGGMGLTGLITWAEIQMRPIVSPLMRCEAVQFRGIEEFVALALASQNPEYSIAWMDAIASGSNFARGIFMTASHSEVSVPLVAAKPGMLGIPFDLPAFTLNRYSVGFFNALYFHRHWGKSKPRQVGYDLFFYPLDRVAHWNRLYGRQGLMQFHGVLPWDTDQHGLLQLLKAVSGSRLRSFFATLKVFGDAVSPGIMSFPMPGISLALDLPVRGDETLDLMDKLARITVEHGGRIYPAKDAHMTATEFQAFYPQWQQFAAFVDPAFSSSLWERVSGRG
jgi:FAD/FMN-containing dehydrogenase